MSLKQKKIAKKREEILRSAAEVLNEKGFHKATMEDIANRLLMTKGAMYYYFKNKEDLYFECHKMIMDISIEKIKEIIKSDRTSLEKLKDSIVSHIVLSIEEQDMFSIMNKPEEKFEGEYLEDILKQRSDYERYFDIIIKEGINDGTFSDVDIKMVRLIILGALNWIHQWHSPQGGKSQEEIAESFADYLLKMVIK